MCGLAVSARAPQMLIHRERGAPINVHAFGGSGPCLLFAPANGFHGLCYKPVVCIASP